MQAYCGDMSGEHAETSGSRARPPARRRIEAAAECVITRPGPGALPILAHHDHLCPEVILPANASRLSNYPGAAFPPHQRRIRYHQVSCHGLTLRLRLRSSIRPRRGITAGRREAATAKCMPLLARASWLPREFENQNSSALRYLPVVDPQADLGAGRDGLGGNPVGLGLVPPVALLRLRIEK
jgi:hypothetical protein